MMRKTYEFRLRPTKSQERRMNAALNASESPSGVSPNRVGGVGRR